MKAIIQLQETAEKLINLNQPLNEVFILCEKIGKQEKSIYQRVKIKGICYLKDKNAKEIVKIEHNGKSFPIKLFYEGEIKC